MKWFFASTLLLIAFTASATTRTVCNLPANLAQYNNIQDAINASNNGDTVLVQGTSAGYPGFTINNKRVIVIGPGFSPDMQSPYPVLVVGNCTITGVSSKKSEIHGIQFYGGNQNIQIGSSLDSLYFYRNILGTIYIAAGSTVSGFVFSGNYFLSEIISHPYTVHQNFLFENNVFENSSAAISSFDNASNTNILFNHNLFFSGNGDPGNAFSNVSNVMFVNNIFVDRNFDNTLTQSSFTNNITFNCSPNNPWNFNGNTNVAGNIAGMDPQMTDQAAVNNGSAGPISNFTISSGPANNSATDGKDMGLLFDPTGGRNWIYGRNARIPSVVLMNILNPVLIAGQTLNINVIARKNE